MTRRLFPAWIAAFGLLIAGCHHPSTGTADAPASAGTSASAELARAEAEAAAGRAHRAQAMAAGMLAARGLAAEEAKPASQDGLPPGTLGDPDENGYAELEWTRMMPKDDVKLLEQAPPVVHIGTQRGKQFGTLHAIAALDGRKVRLPGYVVPLGSDDAGRMNEFFFVPFYGACIHVPPPPPNMMVHVTLAHGVDAPQLWDAFWLEGVLRIETTRNSMAESAYAMHDATLQPYSDDNTQNLRNAFE